MLIDVASFAYNLKAGDVTRTAMVAGAYSAFRTQQQVHLFPLVQ